MAVSMEIIEHDIEQGIRIVVVVVVLDGILVPRNLLHLTQLLEAHFKRSAVHNHFSDLSVHVDKHRRREAILGSLFTTPPSYLSGFNTQRSWVRWCLYSESRNKTDTFWK